MICDMRSKQLCEEFEVLGAWGEFTVLAGGNDFYDFIVYRCCNAVLSAEVTHYAVNSVDLAGLAVLNILEH